MPESLEYRYKCTICGEIYKHKDDATAERLAYECEQGHDIVYIPLLKSDLQRLLAFITTGERKLLTKTLVDTLRAFRSLK